MNLVIPKEIRKYIDNQNFQIDFIGRSKDTKMILKDYALKMETMTDEVANEVRMLKWWKQNLLPVPDIIESIEMNGTNYLLMEKLKGGPSYEVIVRISTEELIDILASSLKRLWKIDVSECPSSQRVEDKLKAAKARVDNNLVELDESEFEAFGLEHFTNPQELWQWLDKNRPTEDDLVLAHGDFTLPNLITNGRYLNGFIDLGQSGVSDKYQDISIAYRSLMNNLRGKFGILKEFTDEEIGHYTNLFFEELEIDPDWDKINYYILLDELF